MSKVTELAAGQIKRSGCITVELVSGKPPPQSSSAGPLSRPSSTRSTSRYRRLDCPPVAEAVKRRAHN